MVAEAFGLCGRRGMLIEIIEASFADGNNFRVLRKPHDLTDRDVEFFVRLMGMRPDRSIDVIETLDNRLYFRKTPDARRDIDKHADACRMRARNHAVEIGFKFVAVDMAVVIDEHAASKLRVPPLPIHFIRMGRGDSCVFFFLRLLAFGRALGFLRGLGLRLCFGGSAHRLFSF